MKAEARLVLLSDSVPGIELWLHDAMNQAEEELERERRLSEQRKSTEDFSVHKHTHSHTHKHTQVCSGDSLNSGPANQSHGPLSHQSKIVPKF